MKTQLRLTLLIATVLYLIWGLALLFAPVAAHAQLSMGPFDAASSGMFGVALLVFAAAFFIAARHPIRDMVAVSAIGLALIGLSAAVMMFGSRVMAVNAFTLLSLVVDLGAATLLLLMLARMRAQHEEQAAAPPRHRRGKAEASSERPGYNRT
jgi:hypothetical protein